MVNCILFFILIFPCAYALKECILRGSKCIYGPGPEHFFGGISAAFGGFAAGFISYTSALYALKIWLAPKVYLLEYAAQLIGKK